MLAGILVPLFVFGTIFGIVYIFLTTRNKERLALIEKGADAKLFNSGPSGNIVSIVVLNIALLAIGIGIGVLLAGLLMENGMDEEIAYPSMIFTGGGIGLLASFIIARKIKNNTEE